MGRFRICVALLLAAVLHGCALLQDDSAHAPGLESPLLDGNRVTLLFDGAQATSAMEEAIRSARSSIHLETYIFDQDALGQRFADLLMERQRAGVRTRVIYDAVGTVNTPDAFFVQLREAGVELLAFHPVNPFKLHGPWQPNRRDHRKILVVDGRIAFTGGVNISQSYASGSLFHKAQQAGDAARWRDTHLQIEGPAVNALQAVFLQTWNAHLASPVARDSLLPPQLALGHTHVQVIASEPHGQMEIYAAYLRAIHAARSRIFLTCAYFVPDAAMLEALLDAARRGVDVEIILPGVQEGGIVFYASHAFFEPLLAGGVRLFQMHEVVLHAKTAVIDGHWSTVGSTNLDTRSFLQNSEINVIVIDDAFGRDMEAAFASDLQVSEEVRLATWRARPLGERIKEWAAMQFDYWL